MIETGVARDERGIPGEEPVEGRDGLYDVLAALPLVERMAERVGV